MSSDKEILALEDKRYAAMCGGDFAVLEAMLHDELLYTHSSGLTDTKVTWLASLRSGKTKYKSAACSDRKVRLAATPHSSPAAQRSRWRSTASRAASGLCSSTPGQEHRRAGNSSRGSRRRSPPRSNRRPTSAITQLARADEVIE
jgi:hypothetical protein